MAADVARDHMEEGRRLAVGFLTTLLLRHALPLQRKRKLEDKTRLRQESTAAFEIAD
jgi:hypothetical protein